MRRPIAIALALLMALVIAAPVQAATPQRVFKASFGTNGSGTFTYFTDQTGTMTWALKGLKRSASYKATVFRGKCSSLGTAVTSLGYITTTSTGALKAVRGVSTTKSKAIWEANWYKVLSLKIVSGKSVRCGALNYTHVTRVRMPNVGGFMSAKIDMAVVRGPSGYPYCNVAMYNGALSQPREPETDWATFVFAHARKGMFLPLLKEYQQNGGSQLIGKYFYLYTSDNKMHAYRIDSIATGLQVQMNKVYTAGLDKAWLQTSTGPNYTYPKLFVKASWVSTVSVTYAEAHPTPHIVKCG